MIIKSKLSQKDFINGNFVLLYSKISTKLLTGIFIFLVLISLLTVIFLPEVPFTDLIAPLLMLAALPAIVYIASKRKFRSDKRVSETIEYSFDDIYLNMKGESFNAQLTWDKIYKVTQTKNWILIWQNKQFANLIPRRDIWDGEISKMKGLLDKHQVKNNL